MEAIDHLDLVVSRLARSLPFYRGLLGPLGYVRESDIVGERGERVVYLNRAGRPGSLGLRESLSETSAAPYDRYAVGMHHVAFAAPSRVVVDERAKWASDHGATIESGPREYDYTPGYYSAFSYDPDGIKLEIVHVPPDRDLVSRHEALSRRVADLEGKLRDR